MIEKLIAGRYLSQLGTNSFSFQQVTPPYLPEHFTWVINSIQNMTQSANVEHKGTTHRTSHIMYGENIKTHRNFVWLPYIPGKVTYVRNVGLDILTGPMSGCWIVSFQIDGINFVAHIGTDGASETPTTRQVKEAWRQFASLPGIVIGKAFNPIKGVPATDAKNIPRKEFYAAIDGRGDFYTLILGGKEKLYSWTGGKQICAIYKIHPQAFDSFNSTLPPSTM